MSSGYQLHKFKENMFQRLILFQIKVIAETWCQLCLELSQPCLRALRNSPFIHWEVATNCAWLQATKMLYSKKPEVLHSKQPSLNFANRTAQPPKDLPRPKGVKYSYSTSSQLLPPITSLWTVFIFYPRVLAAGFSKHSSMLDRPQACSEQSLGSGLLVQKSSWLQALPVPDVSLSNPESSLQCTCPESVL